jgi:hypothetical protein
MTMNLINYSTLLHLWIYSNFIQYAGANLPRQGGQANQHQHMPFVEQSKAKTWNFLWLIPRLVQNRLIIGVAHQIR